MRFLAVVGAASALVVLSVPTAQAAADLTTVAIIDEPRPQSKWGYAPGTRRIQPGTWVTWSNDGYDAHNVTALDGLFDSGDLNPSEGFSFYFAEAGTFAYVCTLHPWMTGRIIVGGSQLSAVSDQPSVATGSSAGDRSPTNDEISAPAEEVTPASEETVSATPWDSLTPAS
jgi:plastocyanin